MKEQKDRVGARKHVAPAHLSSMKGFGSFLRYIGQMNDEMIVLP